MDIESDTALEHRWSWWTNELNSPENPKGVPHFLGTIGSVFEFWAWYDSFPKPSEYFNGKGSPWTIPAVTKAVITGLSFFKEGISPTWEDRGNVGGYTYRIIIPPIITKTFLDELALEPFLVSIGNEYLVYIDDTDYNFSDYITGIRLFDRRGRGAMVEVWFCRETPNPETFANVVLQKMQALISMPLTISLVDRT